MGLSPQNILIRDFQEGERWKMSKISTRLSFLKNPPPKKSESIITYQKYAVTITLLLFCISGEAGQKHHIQALRETWKHNDGWRDPIHIASSLWISLHGYDGTPLTVMSFLPRELPLSLGAMCSVFPRVASFSLSLCKSTPGCSNPSHLSTLVCYLHHTFSTCVLF